MATLTTSQESHNCPVKQSSEVLAPCSADEAQRTGLLEGGLTQHPQSLARGV